MTLRVAHTRLIALAVLAVLALVALAACDSPSAPAQAPPTPIGAGPAPTETARTVPTGLPASPPTQTGDQPLPPAQGTVGQVPQVVPTGGPAQVPPAQPTGSPVLVTPGAVDPNEPPRVTLQELQELLKQPDTLLVDVRSAGNFQERHIKGAVSFPFLTVEQQIAQVPRDKFIVAYCQ